MLRRALALVVLASWLASPAPAAAQGSAPRSPSDRAVDLRQGAPDLALDSRVASTSPTPVGRRGSDGPGAWTDTFSGGVMIGFGSLLLVGSAITAGLAVHSTSHESPDPFDQADAEATTTGLAAGSVALGAFGLLLTIPGIVLVAGDDGAPVATAHVGALGGGLDVRF